MYMTLAPSAVGIQGLTFGNLLSLAKQNGFEAVDVPLAELAELPHPQEAAKELRDLGLRWGGFGLPIDFHKDEGNYRKALAPFEPLIALAQQLDVRRCTTWIMPGDDVLDYAANLRRHVERLKPIAENLDRHRIRLGLEFIGPQSFRSRFRHEFVHNIDQVLELTAAISPNLSNPAGVLLDSFHWYTSQGTLEDIRGKLQGQIIYVHVSDACAGRAIDQQVDHQRALPGDTGMIDLKGFLQAVRDTGFKGPVAAEPFMSELTQLPADEVAARVAESIRRILPPPHGSSSGSPACASSSAAPAASSSPASDQAAPRPEESPFQL